MEFLKEWAPLFLALLGALGVQQVISLYIQRRWKKSDDNVENRADIYKAVTEREQRLVEREERLTARSEARDEVWRTIVGENADLKSKTSIQEAQIKQIMEQLAHIKMERAEDKVAMDDLRQQLDRSVEQNSKHLTRIQTLETFIESTTGKPLVELGLA